jgi:hypothetical protein
MAAVVGALAADAVRGGGVTVGARDGLTLAGGGEIYAAAAGTGGTGTVTVRSGGAIAIDGGGSNTAPAPTGILAETGADLAPGAPFGRLGDIRVRAATLNVTSGGLVANVTHNQLAGGNVRVQAGRITLDGKGAGTAQQEVLTGIATQSVKIDPADVPTGEEGHFGRATVRADDLTILGGAGIAADSFTGAAGGGVRVSAHDLFVDAESFGLETGIDTTNRFTGTLPGNKPPAGAGSIAVRAFDLTLQNQSAAIISNTFGSAPAGDVRVGAHRILVDRVSDPGTFDTLNTGIGAQVEANAAGHGGRVSVNAEEVTVRNTGRISVTTAGSGAAGDLSLDVGTLRLESGGRIESNSQSQSADAGAGGNLNVQARDTVTLSGGGTITVGAQAARGGNVTVAAGQTITATGVGSDVSARVFSTSTGGNIHVQAPLFVTFSDGAAITAASGGNGGNITVDPLRLTLAGGSRINANGGANGGKITLAADQANPSTGVVITPGKNPEGNPGDTVTASGGTGTSGSITTNPANTDVTNALARLPSGLTAIEQRLQPLCGAGGGFSSFLLTGNGGLSFDPATWDLAPAYPSDAAAPGATTHPSR